MKNILKHIVMVLVIGLVGCQEANKRSGTEHNTHVSATVQDSTIVNPNAGASFTLSAGESVTNTGGSTGAAGKAGPRPDDYRGDDDNKKVEKYPLTDQ